MWIFVGQVQKKWPILWLFDKLHRLFSKQAGVVRLIGTDVPDDFLLATPKRNGEVIVRLSFT